MRPIDASEAAHKFIMSEVAARLLREERPVEVRFVIIGAVDGRQLVETPVTRHPDVEIYVDDERYTLHAFGESVTGLRHTLSRVLLTRLAQRAALNPANKVP